jgi:HTH-type transcriptional regulator / antitoxin HigA
MAHTQHSYQPDYAPPPGKTLEEFIEARDLSARELARRCGRSAKLVVEIIAGKAPIEPETAMQLERVLGMDASVWLNMEAAYRLHLARAEEAKTFEEMRHVVARFPITELTQRGLIRTPANENDRARELLRFFGAGNFSAFKERYDTELRAVSFRHSPTFQSELEPLLAWLRIGEIQAESAQIAPFERTAFFEALKRIRSLTVKEPKEFEARMKVQCAQAGVLFLLVPPFSGLRLSGIARWVAPGKAVIQQTLRHKTNDHFWFTFFHEAAHLWLHSRKGLFIDGEQMKGDAKEEEEANNWAANFLVPQNELGKFIATGMFSRTAIVSFAEDLGIAPAIVVGQLQNRRVIPWKSPLNRLKILFQWTSKSENPHKTS